MTRETQYRIVRAFALAMAAVNPGAVADASVTMRRASYYTDYIMDGKR